MENDCRVPLDEGGREGWMDAGQISQPVQFSWTNKKLRKQDEEGSISAEDKN